MRYSINMCLYLTLILLFYLALTSSLRAERYIPNEADLKSGDLLWVKGADEIIPYAAPEDSETWKERRDQFLQKNKEKQADYSTLRNLTYNDFNRGYFFDRSYGETVENYSSGDETISVGHMAIVEVTNNGKRYVIEAASPRLGVIKTQYKKWVSQLGKDRVIWAGRFDKKINVHIPEIIKLANKQVGKSYDFWNFDLSDDKAFYCSKLIWYIVWKVTNIALDDNVNPTRFIWFSPKQALKYAQKRKHVHIFFTPDIEF